MRLSGVGCGDGCGTDEDDDEYHGGPGAGSERTIRLHEWSHTCLWVGLTRQRRTSRRQERCHTPVRRRDLDTSTKNQQATRADTGGRRRGRRINGFQAQAWLV